MKTKNQNWIANGLIVVSTLARLLPHPANMTPIGAVSLVGGAKLDKVYKWLVTFAALIISDHLLGIFKGVEPWSKVTLFIYASFAINILLGSFIKGDHRYLKLGTFSIVGSLQFFAISNLGIWAEGIHYSRTWEGLVQCYVMALPYLTNTFFGDLLWSLALFAIIERAQAWSQKRSLQSVHS